MRGARRVRWAGVEDDGTVVVAADRAAENAAAAAPQCPWDSRRWPVGGPISLAGRMYAMGKIDIGHGFRIPGVGKQEWILRNISDFEWPQHVCFGLMANPIDRTTCLSCGRHRHLNKPCDERRQIKNCDYELCDYFPAHTKSGCPTLNNRCSNCMMRGHSANADRCLRVLENFEIFEAEAR